MRDLVQVAGPLGPAEHDPEHAAALEERLASIKSGETDQVWRAFN
jgi:hypothetical protein